MYIQYLYSHTRLLSADPSISVLGKGEAAFGSVARAAGLQVARQRDGLQGGQARSTGAGSRRGGARLGGRDS